MATPVTVKGEFLNSKCHWRPNERWEGTLGDTDPQARRPAIQGVAHPKDGV